MASANVEPNPAIIPADAAMVRNAAPAHRKSGETVSIKGKLHFYHLNSGKFGNPQRPAKKPLFINVILNGKTRMYSLD